MRCGGLDNAPAKRFQIFIHEKFYSPVQHPRRVSIEKEKSGAKTARRNWNSRTKGQNCTSKWNRGSMGGPIRSAGY